MRRKALIVVALVGILSSCGKKTGRFDYSGQVLFDGQPVPAGEVTFVPDKSQQNSGPATIARIKNGRYETPAGKGCVGGPHVVKITGQDGIPPGKGTSLDPFGKVIFHYQVEVDLPRESGTYDFEVPASAAKNVGATPSRK